MADEAAPAPAPAPTADPAGIPRAPDGTLAKPAATTTPSPTTETKTPPPATEAKAEGEGEGSLLNREAPAAPEGAPATYADYKVPEGFTIDAETKTRADALFKGMGLSQDQAQSLVDFYTEETRSAFNAPFEAYQETRKEWRAAAESDPALRGKLGPGGEVLTTISRALDSLGDPKLASDFRQAMDLTGVGDNPAFIKAFFRWAQKISEGTYVAGRGPSEHGQVSPGRIGRTAAQDLWPNLPSSANQR